MSEFKTVHGADCRRNLQVPLKLFQRLSFGVQLGNHNILFGLKIFI